MKKRLFLFAPLALMLLTACFTVTGGNVSVINGDDSEATIKKDVKIGSFDEIKVSQGIKVVLEQGKNTGTASIATTPSAEKYLKVTMDGNTLRVYYDTKDISMKKIKGPSIVRVKTQNLEEADLSSGASLLINGTFTSNSKMEIDMSSGSCLSIENLTCPMLSLETSSGSNANVARLKGDLDADSSSGSEIVVSRVSGEKISLDSSSGSTIKVNGVEGGCISVNASSGSDIYVKSIATSTINATASSGGSVSLSGKTNNLINKSSSGGSVNTGGLTVSK